MCGICGAFAMKGRGERLSEKVSAMTRQLSHRGPDNNASINLGSAEFGHCRLKIIDTTQASDQPFPQEKSRYKLVYNGEFYNYRAIRKFLIDRYGIQFSTTGDTEVLYQLLVHEGVDGLTRINGMFAFAFWDAEAQRLMLARDRLGIKPLYILQESDQLYFSSEIRPLISIADSAQLNSRALVSYLMYQSVRGSQTLIDGIQEVEPGEVLVANSKGVQTQQYYTLDPQAESIDYHPDDLKERFYSAVQQRLVSDVPLGAFLSGGIDSTAVVSTMTNVSANAVKTFTLGFEQGAVDERDIAERFARHYETDHTEITLSSRQILQQVPNAVASMDQPSGDAINSYIISKYTRDAGLTVALSGLGGDELFGGYPSFKWMHGLRSIRWLMNHTQRFRQFMAELLPKSSIQQQKIRMLLKQEATGEALVSTLRRVLLDDQLHALGLHLDSGDQQKQLAIPDDDFNDISYHELIYYTIPLLLQDTDQMSMAHGLEVRVPFLDHEFVEYIYSLKNPVKHQNLSGTSKALLIDALEPQIPDFIQDRPKTGFVLPMDRWIRRELRNFTRQGLFESPLTAFIEEPGVDKLWKQYLDEDATMSWSRIWTLSVLGHWLEHNNIGI